MSIPLIRQESGVEQYLKEIQNVALLTALQEQQLAKRMKKMNSKVPAQAQEPPKIKPFTLEVEVDVVSVTAVVFDKAGKPVRGLGTKDVVLTENGVKQDVSYFREASSLGDPAERVPLSVVLVLDTSGSMAQNLRFLQEAVLNFVYKLEEVDTALVVSFNESVKGSAEFTGDIDRLERFIEGLQAWGGTSLYDAIQYSLGRIKDAPGRKALIVFSDGADLAHPGALSVAAVRRRDRRLCQSFVRLERPEVAYSPFDTWPTYAHGERAQVAGDNWNGHWNERPEEGFDLNNDGRIDRPVEASGFGGRGANFLFWALPPREIDDAERARIVSELSFSNYEPVVARLRAEGWTVYTGAETRFAAVDWVFLNVVLRDAQTYLLAEHRGSSAQILLRPTPDGGLREMCVFERSPDL